MKKQVSRCDRKSGRGKTTDFEREDFSYVTDDWVLPTGQGIKKAYQALFWQHARWAREEFYWNCPIIGMRVVSFFYRIKALVTLEKSQTFIFFHFNTKAVGPIFNFFAKICS